MKTNPRASFDELTLGDDGRHYLHGVPFSGIAYETFDNNTLMSENEFVDGIEQGVAKIWSANGQLLECATRWRGVFHGKCSAWTIDGSLVSESWYEFGIKTAEIKNTNNRTAAWNLTDSTVIQRLATMRAKFPDAPPVSTGT